MTIKVKNITLAILTVLLAFVVALSTATFIKPARADEATCNNTGIHIEGFDKTTDSKVWSVHTDGSHTLTEETDYIKQGDGAFRTVGQGIADGAWELAKTVDISSADSITFWLYLENADALNNCADGQFVLSDKSDVDSGKICWSLKGNNFVDGWQKVVFKIDSALQNYSVDLMKISHMRIYFVGLSQVCTAIFDDVHANFTEGILLHGFNDGSTAPDGGSITTESGYVKEGDGAFYTKGGGIVPGAFKLPAAVDISKTDAISFKLYLENADTFNNMADGQLALSNKVIDNGGSIDGQKISYSLKGRNFVDGWNTVVIKISDLAKEGSVDLTKICSYRIYFIGLSIDGTDPSTYVTAVFDDLRAIETQFLEEDVEPIESYTVTDADNIISGVFDGMSLVYEGHKQGIASLSKTLSSGDNALNATFKTLESGLAKSGDNELGLGFWLYVTDATKVTSASVAVSSSSAAGKFELNWTISDLTTGWNWIAVKASDATEKDVVDMNSLQRLTVNLNTSASIEVRLDRVRIFNTTKVTDWNTEPAASEAVVMEPVDSVSISKADAVNDTTFSDGVVEIKDHKEGSGAVKLSGTGLKTVSNLSVGKTDLLAADYTPVNEFGVTMWLYVPECFAYEKFLIAVGSSQFGVDGYTNVGRITFNVNVSSLQTGWNWLVLKASNAAEISTDFNANAINWFLIQAQGSKSSENTTYMVDRISVVNAAVASAIAEPAASEKIERNPVSGKIIINCDSTNGVTFSGNTVDTSDKREGKGSVKTEGAGFQLMAKEFEIGKTDLTKETLVLALWVYIEDPTVYDNTSINGQFELSSSGTWDDKEINWEIGVNKTVDFSKMEAGWNWIVLKGSEGTLSGANINFDAINYFRIYVNNVGYTVFKLDRITLTNIDDTETYAEPDWESEIFGGGGDDNFQGANGSEAVSGDTWLDDELIKGDAFDIIVKTTETKGCGSNISYTAIVAAVIVIGGALTLLLVKKKATE